MLYVSINHILNFVLFSWRELVNVDEQKQKEALQEFYENEGLKQKNETRIKNSVLYWVCYHILGSWNAALLPKNMT